MNKKNTNKLLKDFPDLYKQYYLSPQETCMYWGFDISDGWFNLIYELSKKITKLDSKCEAEQVKEKFGQLRYYTGPTTEEVFKLISTAENKSYKICEHCGRPGKPNSDGWIKTLCKKCRKKDNKTRHVKLKAKVNEIKKKMKDEQINKGCGKWVRETKEGINLCCGDTYKTEKQKTKDIKCPSDRKSVV